MEMSLTWSRKKIGLATNSSDSNAITGVVRLSRLSGIDALNVPVRSQERPRGITTLVRVVLRSGPLLRYWREPIQTKR